MVKNLIRALRLPFITASVLPFIFGSLLAKKDFHPLNFILGLCIVIFTHLGSNLVNDYADSRSGLDWQDKKFYGFFGGSKLIQEKVFSEKFYFLLAAVFFTLSAFCVIALTLILGNPSVITYYTVIAFLSWAYSDKPLKLSYRGLGEPIIFLLFGPALVMGGYFLQTQIFPVFKIFMLSLPFGFLTTAILFGNEIPDFLTDRTVGKITWVNMLGPRKSYLIYYLLILMAFLSIFVSIASGYLSLRSSVSLFSILLGIKAAKILKGYSKDKSKLMEAAKLTIALQAIVSLVLIIDIIL